MFACGQLQDAVNYLTWTYLARRVPQNPAFYGLAGTGGGADVAAHLSALVEDTLDTLAVRLRLRRTLRTLISSSFAPDGVMTFPGSTAPAQGLHFLISVVAAWEKLGSDLSSCAGAGGGLHRARARRRGGRHDGGPHLLVLLPAARDDGPADEQPRGRHGLQAAAADPGQRARVR
jgi:hypothetical protein